ncbi:MAG: 7-cyano-7-deazaguanine synthase [Verrucomicrobiales bacterium]
MTEAILLSGGIDSTALAYWRRPKAALTVDYGQASAVGELRAASHIASLLGIDHYVISIDCACIGSGDLAGKPAAPGAPASEWWPFRNQLLLTLAAPKALELGIKKLIVGSVASDSFHADGTAQFYEQIDKLFGMQEGGIAVEAPSIHLTAAELVDKSGVTQGILGWTHSCHKADYACGHCRGCNKHREILHEHLLT